MKMLFHKNYTRLKQGRSLRLSVGLVVLFTIGITYGQFLLLNSCSASTCSDEKREKRNVGETTVVTVEEVEDVMTDERVQRVTEEVVVGERQKVGKERKKEKKRVEEKEEAKHVEKKTERKRKKEGADPEKNASRVSLEIVRWIRTMSGDAAGMDEEFTEAEDGDEVPETRRLLFPCEKDKFKIIGGDLKDEEDLNGSGVIEFDEKSMCMETLRIRKAEGTFVGGQLTGPGRIELKDGSFVAGRFKDGMLNGFVRRFRCKFGECDLFENPKPSLTTPKHLQEVSMYQNGLRTGVAWEFKIGGGVVVGRVEESTGDLTGENVVYIYPDFHTALVGRFQKGVMAGARAGEVMGIEYVDGIAIPKTTADMTAPADFEFDKAGKTDMGKHPMLRDPYEEQYVEVRPSKVEGAGRGVFMKKSAPKGTVVAFYNGVHLTDLESRVKTEDRKSPYRIDNDWAEINEVMNVPEGFRELHQYNASYGHLLNHANKPNCWFAMMDHPRFGKIRSIALMMDVEAGEELLVNYGYMDTFFKREAALNTILGMGQFFYNTPTDVFQKDLKKHIQYIKETIQDVKPYADMAKSLFNMVKS